MVSPHVRLPFAALLVAGLLSRAVDVLPIASAQDGASPAVPPAVDLGNLRAKATTAALAWNASARLFRVDLWGVYSRSRFRGPGNRFLFFAPGPRAMEVRIENDVVKTSDYPLDANPPVALPDNAIDVDDATARLWELAPTIQNDQVYLQLLTTGIERPTAVNGDGEATSCPIRTFLNAFPVPIKDDEKAAPVGRAVWRMLAERDHDVLMDQGYGAFIYVDAKTGEALSRREPAVGVQVYLHQKLTPPSPIGPFEFPKGGDVPADAPAERIGTFDPLLVGQKIESMDMGLRLMVRDNRTDVEIGAAIDQMLNYAARMEQVRQADAAGGVAALEASARRDPANIGAQTALFGRYVKELEKERRAVLARIPGGTNADPPPPHVHQARNGESSLWLINQFELNGNGLDNPNQTGIEVDLRTGKWTPRLGGVAPTPSKYYAATVKLAVAIRALGKQDFDFERQVTRAKWLITGGQAAIGDSDTPSIDPADPLALMCYAESTRLDGVGKLVGAERLRKPKVSYRTSDRQVGPGTVERTTTTTVRYPTAEELAAASRMEQVALQQEAPQVSQIQDLAMKLDPNDPRVYYLWARIEAVYYDKQLADRIIQRGLLIDPGCAELHAARTLAWAGVTGPATAEVHLVSLFAKPYAPNDLKAANQLAKYDMVAAFFMGLQRLRLDPATVVGRSQFLDVLRMFDGTVLNGVEIMPDAVEQHQREARVAALIDSRLLNRPDAEWASAFPPDVPITRELLVQGASNFYFQRGSDLKQLGRTKEARLSYEKAIQVDPNNRQAQQQLQAL